MNAPERIWANEGLEWHSFDCSDVKPGWTHPYILATPEALSAHPAVRAMIAEAVAAERERLLRPDLGFVCECGMSGPCMANNCKSPILDMIAAAKGETP